MLGLAALVLERQNTHAATKRAFVRLKRAAAGDRKPPPLPQFSEQCVHLLLVAFALVVHCVLLVVWLVLRNLLVQVSEEKADIVAYAEE